MKTIFTFLLISFTFLTFGQQKPFTKNNRFKFIEIKSHGGSFLKSEGALSESGLLDNGYGGVTVKLGWQPTDPEGWASSYGYPSYGVGYYTGFLSDAEVFGNPNALYGFIKFPISDSSRRNVFAIEPSLGLTYKLNPYDSETNPLNEAIGARMAVYFNIDFGFTYKWTREVDILYGIDFSHFSNGSTYKPNSGLNLFGLNLGIRYNYNANQSAKGEELYTDNPLPVRFRRPKRSPTKMETGQAVAIYFAGGVAQNDALIGSGNVMGTFTGLIDYEYQLNEKSVLTGGFDLFYDNRLQNREASNRWHTGVHVGYDFRFYKFATKMQIGTYLGDDKDKGAFFMRPSLRYYLSDKIFVQVGLKTLDGGAADYIEYGIGFQPFSW